MGERQCAIVTGASSGVGATTALTLAQAGWDVVIVARRADRLDDVSRQISRNGGSVRAFQGDLTDPLRAEMTMRDAWSWKGHVDALVNCLGTNVPERRLSSISIPDWDAILATNLSAVFYCVRHIVPLMRSRGTGWIVSVSSTAGNQPSALAGAAYSASKAGLNALSAVINLEESSSGIRSCVILPGDIDTEILDKRPRVPGPDERAHMLQPEDVAALIETILQQPPRVLVDEITVRPISSQHP